MTTRFIENPTARLVLTGVQERGARGAVVLGLSEYLAGLTARVGPADYVLDPVHAEWAEPEPDERVQFPSGVVRAEGEGMYELEQPRPVEQLDTEHALFRRGEYVQMLRAEIWATDPEIRDALVAQAENALDPYDTQSGVLLDLDHYFGARAKYALKTLTYEDNAIMAQERYRVAVLGIRASVPVLRVLERGLAIIRHSTKVTTAGLGA